MREKRGVAYTGWGLLVARKCWADLRFEREAAVGEETLGKRFLRISGPLALVLWMVVAARGAETRFDADAVRANNRGVAEMGQ